MRFVDLMDLIPTIRGIAQAYENYRNREVISFTTLIEKAKKLGWDSGENSHIMPDLCEAIRQAAYDGQIKLLGRQCRDDFISLAPNQGVLESIPTEFVKDGSIIWDFEEVKGNYKAKCTKAGSEMAYHDLHIKGNVERWVLIPQIDKKVKKGKLWYKIKGWLKLDALQPSK